MSLFWKSILRGSLKHLCSPVGAHNIFDHMRAICRWLGCIAIFLCLLFDVPINDQAWDGVVLQLCIDNIKPITVMYVVNFYLAQLVWVIPSLDLALGNWKRVWNLEIERYRHSVCVALLVLTVECRLCWLLKLTMTESRFSTLRILLLILFCLSVGQVVILIGVVFDFEAFLAPHVMQKELHLGLELDLLIRIALCSLLWTNFAPEIGLFPILFDFLSKTVGWNSFVWLAQDHLCCFWRRARA